jgi:hypothetical protein
MNEDWNIVMLTNVFEKHTDVVPEHEINTAKKYRIDGMERFSIKDFVFRRTADD